VRSFLRRLSPRAEFSLVVIAAFGLPIFHSLGDVFRFGDRRVISEAHLHFLLLYELTVLAALLIFLGARGWTLGRIGLRAGAKDSLLGLGLAVTTYVAYVAAFQLTAMVFSMQPASEFAFVVRDLRLGTLTLASIVNPVFEEIFVCGYVISALEREGWSRWTAINVSMTIRLLYHLYQGALGVINIIAVGLIFSYWYARSGRLWPVIVAHAAIDFVSLLPYVTR
jgi:uncharacterized protein